MTISYSDLYLTPDKTFTGYEYGNEADILHYDAVKDVVKSPPVSLSNIPDEVDFSWHVLENQMRQGSCQGHSLTSCMEGCFWIDTGGDTVQLSRNAGYRFSQLEDGINGDQGSTLSGGVKAAKKGIPLEEYFPYTETYSRRIPRAAYDNRSDFRLTTAVPIQKKDPAMHVVDWIGNGKGFCAIGMKWNSEMNAKSIRRYTGRGSGGGHAIAFLGYSMITKTLKLVNSWGYGWGVDGVKDVTFQAFNQIMKYGWNHGYLYTDLADIERNRDVPDYSIIGDVV